MAFQLIKPMLPSLVHDIPSGAHWFYEIKYDGYRTILHWDKDHLLLQSRNLHSLNEQFPEVVDGLLKLNNRFQAYFPLIFDTELCVLVSNEKADFSSIQQRGRLKEQNRIKRAAMENTAKICVFDILQIKGRNLLPLPFIKRKQQLKELLTSTEIPLDVQHNSTYPLVGIQEFDDPEKQWMRVKQADSEGIIAKKWESTWQSGRTRDWLKIKNFKHGLFIITGYNPANGFVHVSVIRSRKLFPIGVFLHGLEGNERNALIQIINKNKIDVVNGILSVEPRICVELEYLELYKEQLRQPRFISFRLDKTWEACTWEALQMKGN